MCKEKSSFISDYLLSEHTSVCCLCLSLYVQNKDLCMLVFL